MVYVAVILSEVYVTDVTARYASDWLTTVRKSRVDNGWWEETLRPFRPPSMLEIMEENEDIAGKVSSHVVNSRDDLYILNVWGGSNSTIWNLFSCSNCLRLSNFLLSHNVVH